MEVQTLESVFSSFSGGSDGRTLHWANRKFVTTEGVDKVAERAGAHWFVDIVATEFAPKFRTEWIHRRATVGVLKLKVADGGTAVVELTTEDEKPPLFVKQLSYTDFPSGEWVFFMQQDAVIGDPDNDQVGYTVMMLNTEY